MSVASVDRRVVITGVGVVSCGGVGRSAFWRALCGGRSCLGPITRFDASELKVRIAGELRGFDAADYLPRTEAAQIDRCSAYAAIAADEALRESGLDRERLRGERVLVCLGTSMGGAEMGIHRAFLRWCRSRGPHHGNGNGNGHGVPADAQADGPRWLLASARDRIDAPDTVLAGDLSETLLQHLGVPGRAMLISTGCTAASDAIGHGIECLQQGLADVAIVGGSEAPIGPLTVQAFDAIGALSHRNDAPARASRPFDRERDGFVLAEGAGLLVLETLSHARRRGASMYGELAGYQTACDAYHLTASDPAMTQASRTILSALAQADLQREEIGYISAHASSTPMNDQRETDIVKAVFGEAAYRIPISGIKSVIGHTSGAAGGMQAVSCALALRHQQIPPTANYETPDPACDLDYVPNVARQLSLHAILQNTYAFAGKNVALVYRQCEE